MIAMSTRTDEEERLFAQLHGAACLVDKFYLSEQLLPSIRGCAFGKRPLTLTSPRRPTQINRFAS
jgi:hypothetical protein